MYITVAIAGGVFAAALLLVLRTLGEEFRKDRVPVLLYHRLISHEDIARGVPDNEPVMVSYADRFRAQMEYLRDHGFHALSVDQFLLCAGKKKPLPPRPVMITFDDGFGSVYRYGYPVLQEYGLTATLFVTPDPESGNFKALQGIDSPLTAEQLGEMSNAGIAIGSHGMTHRLLTDVSEEEIVWELVESKSVLERITGKPARSLAIPAGAYNRRVRDLAVQAGYEAVFGNKKGSNSPRSDLCDLRRMVVERDFSLADFERFMEPSAAFRGRVIGWLKYAPRYFLGAERTIRARNWFYRSRAGSFLAASLQRILLWQK